MRKEKEKRNKKACPEPRRRVVIAMSGGVDSAVAAALLKRTGFDVIGVFMKFWNEPFRGSLINTDEKTDSHGNENRCCSTESENRARRVAKILNIPFHIFNFEKEFKKRIVDYFLKDYKKGNTPNPCVVCNKEIKFGLFLEKALKLDADYIATGHYAKTKKIENRKQKIEYKLLKAKDKNKDQSYFLWRLNQNQLERILFPVGNYTRTEVEKMARKLKLPFANVKKSMEICFIQTNIEDFLKKYLRPKPGVITLKDGKRIGEHKGLPFYTIGQRKGIKLPGGPYYVLDKDFKKNLLIVTKNEKDLYKKELIAKNINWIHPVKCHKAAISPRAKLFNRVKAKIRYRHSAASAIITEYKRGEVKIIFDKPQRAITPGQSVVFCKGQELLGGGVIK